MEKGIEVYRCKSCNSAFLLNLKNGEGCPCGSRRFSPTNPSMLEKVRLFPKVMLRIYKLMKKNRENKNGRQGSSSK